MITKNIARNDNTKHKTQKIDNIKNDDIKNEQKILFLCCQLNFIVYVTNKNKIRK